MKLNILKYIHDMYLFSYFYWMNISYSEFECFLCIWLSACILHEFSKLIFSKIPFWTKKFNFLFSTYFACKIIFDPDCVHSKIYISYFELWNSCGWTIHTCFTMWMEHKACPIDHHRKHVYITFQAFQITLMTFVVCVICLETGWYRNHFLFARHSLCHIS